MIKTGEIVIETFDNGTIKFDSNFNPSRNFVEVLLEVVAIHILISAQKSGQAPIVHWEEIDKMIHKIKMRPNMYKAFDVTNNPLPPGETRP
jgi:hypothetical protein